MSEAQEWKTDTYQMTYTIYEHCEIVFFPMYDPFKQCLQCVLCMLREEVSGIPYESRSRYIAILHRTEAQLAINENTANYSHEFE